MTNEEAVKQWITQLLAEHSESASEKETKVVCLNSYKEKIEEMKQVMLELQSADHFVVGITPAYEVVSVRYQPYQGYLILLDGKPICITSDLDTVSRIFASMVI